MPEVQLLDFQPSAFKCPVKLAEGGGEGRFGICGMELVSIITAEDVEYGRPHDNPNSVFTPLSVLVQAVNDAVDDLDGEKRADGLWPLLPYLLDTAKAAFYLPDPNSASGSPFTRSPFTRYPTDKLTDALGVVDSGIFPYPSRVIRKYIGITDPDWDKAIYALKVALTIFWSEVQEGAKKMGHPIPAPRTDFTEEEVSRVIAYVEHLKQEYPDPENVDADLSKLLREDA